MTTKTEYLGIGIAVGCLMTMVAMALTVLVG